MNKYFNPRLLNAVIAGTGMKNPVRPHVVLGDQANGFIRGDLMDANAIVEIADQKIKELVNAAPEALDTLKELADALNDDSNFAANIIAAINQKQDTLISGENIKTINGSSILGEGNIVLDTSTYKGLPETWDTTHSMAELIASINADETAIPGKSYLGTVQLSDLPAGMMQAELIIDIMDQLGTDGDKVIVFSLSSADISPYKWEYTSAYGRVGAWRSWATVATLATVASTGSYTDLINKPTIPSLSGYATESWVGQQGYLTSHQDISGKEDKMVIQTIVNSTDASLPITTLSCSVDKYYKVDVPVQTLSIILPSISTNDAIKTVVIYLTGGSSPNITISSAAAGTTIKYQEDFIIQPTKPYEINALWNGSFWVIAAVEIMTN